MTGKRINNNKNVREAIVRPKGDKNINLNNNNLNNINQQLLRSQQHSERSGDDQSLPRGCVVPPRNVVENNVVNVVFNSSPVGCRSAAEIERELTSLILKAQQDSAMRFFKHARGNVN